LVTCLTLLRGALGSEFQRLVEPPLALGLTQELHSSTRISRGVGCWARLRGDSVGERFDRKRS
jgi:hypothetical protein